MSSTSHMGCVASLADWSGGLQLVRGPACACAVTLPAPDVRLGSVPGSSCLPRRCYASLVLSMHVLAASLVPCGKIDKKRRRSSGVRTHAMAKQLPFPWDTLWTYHSPSSPCWGVSSQAHRCQSPQRTERHTKQMTGEYWVRRMCCGPDPLLWFALSVLRIADIIGKVEHVSFPPQKEKGKRKGKLACAGRCCAKRAREKMIVIMNHILKPWQATSLEPWQAMIERHCGLGADTARQRGLGPHVNSCAFISAGQRGLRHSMAPAAWQALRRGPP